MIMTSKKTNLLVDFSKDKNILIFRYPSSDLLTFSRDFQRRVGNWRCHCDRGPLPLLLQCVTVRRLHYVGRETGDLRVVVVLAWARIIAVDHLPLRVLRYPFPRTNAKELNFKSEWVIILAAVDIRTRRENKLKFFALTAHFAEQ